MRRVECDIQGIQDEALELEGETTKGENRASKHLRGVKGFTDIKLKLVEKIYVCFNGETGHSGLKCLHTPKVLQRSLHRDLFLKDIQL